MQKISKILKKIHDLADKAGEREKIIDENSSADEILDLLFISSRAPYDLLFEGAKRIGRKKLGGEFWISGRKMIKIDADTMANAALNSIIRDLKIDELRNLYEESLRIAFDEISFEDILRNEKIIREAEIYAISDGIISDYIPKGYRYAEFSLEDLYYYASADEREILDFIRRWNPEFFKKKFYIKKPRFLYIKPEKIYYQNGKPVLIKFRGRYYYPKFFKTKDPESGKEYKILRIRIPIERLFEEKWGRIKISCIIRLWDGSERKFDLLDIRIKFRGEHEEIPRSQYKFIRQAIRGALENEDLSNDFKEYLKERISKAGSRNFVLLRIYINDRMIDSPLSGIAYRYSRKLRDPPEKAKEYSRYYKGSIILPLNEPKDRYEIIFGNQGIRIAEKREIEQYIRRSFRKKLKAAGIIKYERKEKPEFDPDSKLYGLIMKWRGNAINHIIYSKDYFEAFILEFEKYTIYYIIGSKNGQEFEIINRHHGKEGLYQIKFRMDLHEALEIIHLDPDLPDSEKKRFLAKNI